MNLYLMRSLDKGHDLCVTDLVHGTTTGVFHDSEGALNISELEELATIHSQGRGVVIVTEV